VPYRGQKRRDSTHSYVTHVTITSECAYDHGNRARSRATRRSAVVLSPGVAVNSDKVLSSLKAELNFVNQGGYRNQNGWRPPLYFEDSMICRRNRHLSCRTCGCALISFVPDASRFEATACRHIPLTTNGETLEDLYRTGTIEETETAVRSWLRHVISDLESTNMHRHNDANTRVA